SSGNFYCVQQDQLDRIVEHESGRALATHVVNALLALELPPGVTLAAQSNKLRALGPLLYRLPPIETGVQARYGYRLRVEPSMAGATGFPIRARLTVQGREMSIGESTLRVGTRQEYIDAPVDDAVLLTREQFRLANEEFRLARALADDGVACSQ